MKKTVLSLMVLAATLLSAYPALAEIKGGEFSLSPFVGVYIFDSSQKVEPSIAMGARLGYNLTPNWGIEGGLTYGRPRYRGVYGHLINLRGDVLYHFFPQKKLVPFLALGGGWLENSAGPQGGMNATADIGGGLKYFVTDSVALRGDFRQVVSIGPQSNDGTNFIQNSEVTFGFTFQFGGAKAVSPAVEPEPVAAPAPPPPAPPAEETPSCWKADTTDAPAGKILITGLCFKDNTLEIQSSEKIRKYDIFTVSQPSRLVIDISNAASGFKAPAIYPNRLGIAAIRFASYPDYIRIFLDAAQGLILPYRTEETDGSLNITITPTNVPSPDPSVPDKPVPNTPAPDTAPAPVQ